MYFPEAPTQATPVSPSGRFNDHEVKADFYHYWGRIVNQREKEVAVHLLPFHGLDVAAVGHTLLSRHQGMLAPLTPQSGPSLELFLSLNCYFLAIHDLGKFSDNFQGLQPEIARTLRGKEITGTGDTGQESPGYLLWNNSLNEDFTAFFLTKTMGNHDGFNHRLALFNTWAGAITGHNGRAPQKTTQAPWGYFSRENITAARNFSEGCQNLFFRNIDELPEPLILNEWAQRFGRHSHRLTAFSLLCNRLGSDSSFFKPLSKPMDPSRYWTTIALPTARRVLASSTILPQAEKEMKTMETATPYAYLPSAQKTARHSLLP